MKNILLLPFFLLFAASSSAQETFSKTLDIDGYSDIGVSIHRTANGYVGTATSKCNQEMSQCFTVIIMDENLDTLNLVQYQNFPWTIQNAGFGSNSGNVVMEDGTMYFNGAIYGEDGNPDIFLMKTDEMGDSLWMKTYGFPLDDVPITVVPRTDSTLLVYSEVNAIQDDDHLWLMEVDLEGNMVWEGFYAEEFGSVAGMDIEVLDDGDIVLQYMQCASEGPCDTGVPYYMTLTRIGPDNEVKWTSSFSPFDGLAGGSPVGNLVVLDDGSFLVTHRMDGLPSNPRPPILIWVDEDGEVTDLYDDFDELPIKTLIHLMKRSDGLIIGVGQVRLLSYGLKLGAWVFAMTQDGEMVWERYLVNPEQPDKIHALHAVEETPDGSLALIGNTGGLGSIYDVWLVKLDSEGCLEPGCEGVMQFVSGSGEEIFSDHSPLSLFPNPVSGQLNCKVVNLPLHGLEGMGRPYHVVNSLGERVKSGTWAGNDFQIDVSGFASGVYSLILYVDGKVVSEKFLKI